MATTSSLVGAHRKDISLPATTHRHSKIIIACTVGGASLVLTTGLVLCLLVWRRRNRQNKQQTTRIRRRDSRRGRVPSAVSSRRGTLGSTGDFETLTSTARDQTCHWPPTADDLGLPLPQNELWSAANPSSSSDSPSWSRLASASTRTGHRHFHADLLPIATETHFDHVTTAAESSGCDVMPIANQQQVELISHENSRQSFSAADKNFRGYVHDADPLLVRRPDCSLSRKSACEDMTDNTSNASLSAVKTHTVTDSLLRHQDGCFGVPERDKNTWEIVSWNQHIATTSRQSSRLDFDRASLLRTNASFNERWFCDSVDDEDFYPVWVQRIPESPRRFTDLRFEETGLDELPRLVSTNRYSEYDNLTVTSPDVFTDGCQRARSVYRVA